MAGRLTDRIAVVTGGSTGIGQETARKLASEGADIAVADINPSAETRALVEATGQRFFGAKTDVSDEAQVNVFAREVRDALGPVDILVNNAAVVPLADIDNATFEHWKHTFAINADGPFLTAKAFLGDLKDSDMRQGDQHNCGGLLDGPASVCRVRLLQGRPQRIHTRVGGEPGRP